MNFIAILVPSIAASAALWGLAKEREVGPT
jgi:hypothetical protein